MQTIKEIFEDYYKEVNIIIIENISNSKEIAKTIEAMDILTFETRKQAIKREVRLSKEIDRLQAEILKLKEGKC